MYSVVSCIYIKLSADYHHIAVAVNGIVPCRDIDHTAFDIKIAFFPVFLFRDSQAFAAGIYRVSSAVNLYGFLSFYGITDSIYIKVSAPEDQVILSMYCP